MTNCRGSTQNGRPKTFPGPSSGFHRPAARPGGIRPPLVRGRRWAFVVLVGGTTTGGVGMMADFLGADGFTALEVLILTTFAVTFCWITVAFWTAVAGFLLTALRRDPLSLGRVPSPPPANGPIRSRVALVMPIYHEDPSRVRAGLAAVLDSLVGTGHADRFDTHLLSDSTDPRIAREEEVAWEALRREFGASALVHYRRRSDNAGRKAGNISDFCRRWGSHYDFMVVLDADSIMEGSTLLELVRTMEDNPDAGLIQTLPTPVLQDTLFGRMVQFSRGLYGPMVASGLSFWQTDAGNYWGHNAIVRMKPFMEHCSLPKLPGSPPFGGDILSHDVVEGALLRRAGWKVFLLPWMGGSYEEVPGNLLDYAKRDRRWTQGNLQHLRLMPAPGFLPVSRIQFLLGAMSYLSSPVWMLMLLACTLYAAAPGAGFTMPLAGESTGQSILPTYEAGFIVPLLFIVVAVLFLPKVLALLLAVVRHPKRFGGPRRLLASALLEMLAAVIMAPVMMMYHSHFVISILWGRDSGWEPQTRGSQTISWREAWRRTAVITATGLVWAGMALLSSVWLLVWLTPILTGLLLAAPLTRWTSRTAVGELARRRGLFLVPSETVPSRALTGVFPGPVESPAAGPRRAREPASRAAEDDVRATARPTKVSAVVLRPERAVGSMSVRSWASAVALMACVLPTGAVGQVEFPEPDDNGRQGWSGGVNLGFTVTEGNAETSSSSIGAEAIYRTDPHRWTVTGAVHRASAEGEETANRGSLAGQYDFLLAADVFLFGRGRAGYNRPAGVSRRLTYGAGAGYALMDTEQVTLTAEGGAAYISERLTDGETSTEPHALMAQRLAVRVTEMTQIVQSLEYQPRFGDFGTFLAQGELALATRLVGALGLRLALSGEYDSSPFVDEDGVARERLDITFVTGLTFEF